MKATYYTKTGKKEKEITLPKEIFGVKPNDNLIAQAVRVHLTNVRQGTRSTKGRSDLHYSGRKVWKQKGTGRARHGDRTANIFRKGAKAHGPRPKFFHAKMPKRMAKGALLSVLSKKAESKSISIIESLEFKKPQLTKKAAKLMAKLKLEGKVLIVGVDVSEATVLAVRNLPRVRIEAAGLLHTYSAANCQNLLFTKKGYDALVARLKDKKK